MTKKPSHNPHAPTCVYCGVEYDYGEKLSCFCPDCNDKAPMYLSDERYLAALERIKAQIEGGSELEFWDDTTPGNKETHCSWGLCSAKAEQWPDSIDHLFKHKFETERRISPLYREPHQRCPFDRRLETPLQGMGSGCFYTCRVFKAKPKKGEPVLSREQAIALYTRAVDLANTKSKSAAP